MKLLDEWKTLDVIYLDFSKAFSTVSHSIFVFKKGHHPQWNGLLDKSKTW